MRGGHARYGARNVLDDDAQTYWATDDGVEHASLELELERPTLCDRIRLEEPLFLGQRVRAFEVEVRAAGAWRRVAAATTIGARRILVFEPLVAEAVRVTITSARAAPALARVQLFAAR